MNKRIKVKKPSLVAKYTEMAIENISEMEAGQGIYAYRGQENAGWPVESAAYRRIESALGTPPDLEMFIRHHEIKLLEPARMNGYGFKDGRTLSDLELLADLQHHGAATCLIDFTCNFLVALWFACTNVTNSDGKLFIINTNDPNIFLSPEQGDLECSIRKILTFKTRNENRKNSFAPKLKSAKYWHWSPHGINPRILKQDGLFIFGKMSISADENLQHIIIDQADKAELANELRVWGVSREALFKDLPGFASSHAVSVPIQIGSMSTDELIRAGNAATQRGELEKAIQLYDEAESKCGTPNAYLFVFRGNAKYSMKEYNSAIEDFTNAIKIDPASYHIYIFRGITYFSMENYESAIKDYNKVGEFEEAKGLSFYLRGDANFHMKKYNAAILDYTKAIDFDLKSSQTYSSYLHRGIANAHLQNYEYAIIDFNRSIELDPTNHYAYYNRGVANYHLAQYESAIKDYTKTVELDPTNLDAYLNRGRAYAILENNDAARNSLVSALKLAEQQKNDHLVQQIQSALDTPNENDENGDHFA